MSFSEMESLCCTSTVPESAPLASLDSIFKWCQVDVEPYCLNSITIQKRASFNDNSKWRCMLCHDMQNGYLHDRFVQGTHESEAYRFFHWSCIDIFIYFSHKLITIPPATWVDAAHLHGVKILGTVITEWNDGKKNCEEFLENENTITKFVDRLVAIAVNYDIDGWLINIENIITEEKINDLKQFLRLLSDAMHDAINGSLVIWYDSVTDKGKLDWQNRLDPCNRCFFDSCDGIYLNYNWKDEELQQSVELAGQRVHDVYAGIDVFGRGTMGGGGFNTKEPLDVIRSHDLSVAIFAQGWVYEVLGKEEFNENEYEFWNLLLDHLPQHGPCTLPFCTSFCQGFGDRFYHSGNVVDSSPWHNLSLQQYQPTAIKQKIKSRIYWEEAFEGGGCLHLTGDISDPKFKLFSCLFLIEEPVHISYVWKNKSTSDLDVDLILINSDGNDMSCQSIDTQFFKDDETEINGWQYRNLLVDTQENSSKITSVEIRAETKSESNFDFLLGYFQIIPESFLDVLHDSMTVHLLDFVCGGTDLKITALLTWQPSDRLRSFHPTFAVFAYYSDENKFEYLASTRKNIFKLCGITFSKRFNRFVIQPRLLNLHLTPLESCSSVDVTF